MRRPRPPKARKGTLTRSVNKEDREYERLHDGGCYAISRDNNSVYICSIALHGPESCDLTLNSKCLGGPSHVVSKLGNRYKVI